MIRETLLALALLALPVLGKAQTEAGAQHARVISRERLVYGGDSSNVSVQLRLGVREAVAEQLRDPGSITQFRITQVNALIQDDTISVGAACGEFNARNGYGGYAGVALFAVPLKGSRSAKTSASIERVFISEHRTEAYHAACADLGPRESAPWLASRSSKLLFRSGCLASRRLDAADREFFWLLSDALKAGYRPSPAPGCSP